MKIRILAGATPALLVALAAGAPALAACDSPTRALQYLATQQHGDGSVDGAVGETLDFVLGAAAAGYDPRTLTSSTGKSPLDWLASNVAAGTGDPDRAGKLVAGVVAARLDPTAFGGTNLLQALQAYYQPGTGAYIANASDSNDPCQPVANGAICQANAILGLVAAGNATYPVPAKAVAYLKSLQATSGPDSGAWGSYSPGDTNGTAMALMALAAAGDTPANDASTYSAALSFLHTQQDPASGGFPYAAAYGTASDPDSDALVIQGLVAAGEDPAAAAWSNSKGSPVSDLATFQDPSSGGFFFDRSKPTPDALTTSQVPAGLERQPFPLSPRYPVGAALPAPGCGVAGATAAPAPASPTPAVRLPRAGAAPGGAGGMFPALLLAALALPVAALLRRARMR